MRLSACGWRSSGNADLLTAPFHPFSPGRAPHPLVAPTTPHHRHPPSPRCKIHLRRFITSSIWLIRHYLRFAPPSFALSPPPSLNLLTPFFFSSFPIYFALYFRRRAAPRHPSPFILALLLHSLMKSGPRRRPHSATVFLDTPTIYHFVRETLKVSRALIRARGGTMGAIREAEQGRFAYFPQRVGVPPPPPPTRPVDCMNYFSICSKQLGNYYRHNQINNSRCDVCGGEAKSLRSPKENKREFFLWTF